MTSKREVCFDLYLPLFKENADLTKERICVELHEPVATWFDNLLPSEKEGMYSNWKRVETRLGFDANIERKFAKKLAAFREGLCPFCNLQLEQNDLGKGSVRFRLHLQAVHKDLFDKLDLLKAYLSERGLSQCLNYLE